MVGEDDHAGELLPADKLERLRGVLGSGRKPLVIGDRIDDALMLHAGFFGVAMGHRAASAALAASNGVLMVAGWASVEPAVRALVDERQLVAG